MQCGGCGHPCSGYIHCLNCAARMASEIEEQRAHIDALNRQRNLAEETLTRVETERIQAIEERDEARRLARSFYLCIKTVVGDKVFSSEAEASTWLADNQPST